jgi:hypothetical protein
MRINYVVLFLILTLSSGCLSTSFFQENATGTVVWASFDCDYCLIEVGSTCYLAESTSH